MINKKINTALTTVFRAVIILPFLLFGILPLQCRVWSVSELEQPRRYNASNWVSNPDGILNSGTVASLNEMLNDINRRSGAEVAVAVIHGYDGGSIDDFATDLFEEWGIGDKHANTGVLLVVATGPRESVFRTGRGMGSVLTDVETARITRNEMIPDFKLEEYDSGVLAGVAALHRTLTSRDAISEIQQSIARGGSDDDESLWDILLMYFWCSVAITVFLAVWTVYKVKSTTAMERHARYVELHPLLRIIFGVGFVFLFLPFLIYFPFRIFVDNLRNGLHKCPNCSAKMNKLDEVTDNLHLTPSQDAEERFGSVDYDVWLCPECGEEDIYAFRNNDSELVECPNCHARTARAVRDRIIKMPTAATEGLAVKEFECLNCHHRSQKPYKLPRQTNQAANLAAGAAAAAIFGSMGRGGGGGFGGGSFGGGHTGGGGSSSSW